MSENVQNPVKGNSTNLETPAESDDSSVDWWNVTVSETPVDAASFPLDVWAPLLPHTTGLSEITIIECRIDPSLAEELCAPDSTTEQDAIKGKWVRVKRDLNIEGGYISPYLNVYYRRTRRQDINLVTDIELLADKQEPSSPGTWHKVPTSLRAGIFRAPPLFLWYRTGNTAGEMTAVERSNIITELDVLYGEDVPWYGFEKLEPPTMPERGSVEATWLTFRRGVKCKTSLRPVDSNPVLTMLTCLAPPRAPPLHFSRSGKFKIMQVADLHYSVSQGVCRDSDRNPCEHSDNLTSTLVGKALEAEKPDLVVFSGDQLNGQRTTWDSKSVLAKFAKAVTEKGIPWAAVFGNHDEEDGMTKEEQLLLMKGLPYSLVDRGPKDVHGVGNYILKVLSADASKTHLLTLYFLDSGSYTKGYWDFFGFIPTAYDWIREAYAKADSDPRTRKALDVGTSGQESAGNAKTNAGFFEDGVLKAMENDHVGKGNAPEVKAIGNGHCHSKISSSFKI
ncbi:hypothetical protein H0H87_003516 [Tephrocybe sp. NHM501043]|nr:hypothetical protein H0H87_003516 [Tephrocybe sp. NHM501043]